MVGQVAVEKQSALFPKRGCQGRIPIIAGSIVVAEVADSKAVTTVGPEVGGENAGSPALLEREDVEGQPHDRHGPELEG